MLHEKCLMEKRVFKLLFKQESIEIPSHFPNIIDISPYIYQSLLKKGEYIIKSDISEKVFRSFLDHWIYNKTPDITPLNICEYDQLSCEFCRMKDLVEMFTKLTVNNSSAASKSDNYKLKKIIVSRSQYLKEINEKYQKIIEILFQSGFFHSKISYTIKNDLFFACSRHDVEEFYLLTRRRMTQNDITYVLNEKEKTAVLFSTNQVSGDIFIPRSVKDELTQEEYIITSFYTNSFAGANLKSINFSEDSEVRCFYPNTFFNSSIETITIPSSLTELKDGWCFHAINLKNVFIMHNNCHFSYFDNKFIIGKSDQKSDVYDILHFARRDIEEATIPSFVKYISPYAFNYCRKLRKIQFAENSELISIGSQAFSETIIESIIIPLHVTSIGDNAFYFCNHLKKIVFMENSELKSIENSAFGKVPIECLSIPSCVVNFSERWCNETSKLNFVDVVPCKDKNITVYNNSLILGKSDSKSDVFDDLLFACRNIRRVIVPPFIKRIKSMSFSECRKLKSIEFANYSELISIEKRAFYSSSLKSISIPKYVKIIDDFAFSICMRFNRIDLNENTELTEIGTNIFSFTSIKSFSIPIKVTKIGDYAFTNCRSLKIVEIPENFKLKTIKKELFNCSPNVMVMIPTKMRDILHLETSTQKPKKNVGIVNFLKH